MATGKARGQNADPVRKLGPQFSRSPVRKSAGPHFTPTGMCSLPFAMQASVRGMFSTTKTTLLHQIDEK